MAYGTYEFLGEQVKDYGIDPSTVGVAPFPTGPEFDGHYYAVTNFMGIANGAGNPKGAGKLCELVCQKEDEMFPNEPNLASPELTKCLDDKAMDVINYSVGTAQIVYEGGWGTWDPTFIIPRNLYYDSKDPVTVLDSVQPLLQSAINDLLNVTVSLNNEFKAPEPEGFENGLGIMSVDKANGVKSQITTDPNEVVAGNASLKLVSDDVMQVMAYTDTAKVSVPTYKVYKVSLDYKILSADNGKTDFALTSRTMKNIDNDDDQVGYFRFDGKPGDTGTVTGQFELMLDNVTDYTFVIISGVNSGSVSIDNLTITDVTPAQ